MSTTNVNDPSQTANPARDPGSAIPWEGTGAKGAAVPQTQPVTPDAVESVPPHAAQAAPPRSETPEAAQPSTPNKEQLHRRVQSRILELEAAQAQLAGQDGNSERAQGIETELQVARDKMSGGWEHVGQMEAAQLSQWLTHTENLTLAKPAESPAPQG